MKKRRTCSLMSLREIQPHGYGETVALVQLDVVARRLAIRE